MVAISFTVADIHASQFNDMKFEEHAKLVVHGLSNEEKDAVVLESLLQLHEDDKTRATVPNIVTFKYQQQQAQQFEVVFGTARHLIELRKLASLEVLELPSWRTTKLIIMFEEIDHELGTYIIFFYLNNIHLFHYRRRRIDFLCKIARQKRHVWQIGSVFCH
jgi:hypothetical protein